ncbi:LPS assembly lipoprotein LptE [Lichenihabitans sp. Uapishka_5]|uniref:LPS assembly lipoprotein LptE n=1 Tax=Lichenihabitans sp. Uapishka_5 TaxID=3037302 RepID=UPI0029E7E504|nr:LPS assembly lipoprotein LptE [Lichenihabitans sp. Uapishka_5]MDX7952603.1 LPS assembly lipoprotein LptE [Lichenihabitans sp. Uapishka_5]
MWSSELGRIARGAAMAAALMLGGCETVGLHPLYMSRGGDMQGILQTIAVDPIPDRFGHYLADKLVSTFNGTGTTVAPRYHLVVVPHIGTQAPLISTTTQTATAATVTANVDFRLIAVGGGEPVAKGTVVSAATYNRSLQRFANIRAARDAEIRNAETVADQIATQVSAQLATR